MIFSVCFRLQANFYMQHFSTIQQRNGYETKMGSGALPGKMLLVMIIDKNKIDAYFSSG